VNLQIVFACLEKVGDLGIYRFLLLTYLAMNNIFGTTSQELIRKSSIYKNILIMSKPKQPIALIGLRVKKYNLNLRSCKKT